MSGPERLQKLRPLGKLEQVSSSCHHRGFYNNVGLSARYKMSGKPLTVDLRLLIYGALADIILKYPILSAITVGEDTVSPYFARLSSIYLDKSVRFLQRSNHYDAKDSTDPELDAILEEQHNTDFKSDYGTLPFWRLIILQNAGVQSEFTATFVYHHAIGDGISGLVFHRAFCDALETATVSLPSEKASYNPPVIPLEAEILPPVEELHPLPAKENTTSSISSSVQEWTGGLIHAPCNSRYRCLYVSPGASKSFIEDCRSSGLSVTPCLTAVVTTVLFTALPQNAGALTCVIPISLRPWLNMPRHVAESAIGTYIDAVKVQLLRPPNEKNESAVDAIWQMAVKVSEELRTHLTSNCSPSGEPFTAIAGLKSLPDVSLLFTSNIGKARDAALEVSNLGTFARSSAIKTEPLWKLGRMTFSRSTVISGSAITISAVTGGNGGLSLGLSWQEGVVDEALVANLFEGIKAHFDHHGAAQETSRQQLHQGSTQLQRAAGASGQIPHTFSNQRSPHIDMSAYPYPYSQAAKLDPRVTVPRPSIDSALAPIIDSFPFPEELDIQFIRGAASGEDGEFVYSADSILQSAPHLAHEEKYVRASGGNDVTLSIFSPEEPTSTSLPAVFYIHGGGLVSGDRFTAVTEVLELLEGIECVIASVEYRLAPETKAPGPAEDCHACLVWMSANATSLGINPAEIVVLGSSGGGALAAALCLMVRDRQSLSSPIKGQMLLTPMLDDRCESVSDRQFEYGSPWCGVTNRNAWEHVLGDCRGTDKVTMYQAPARATDLSNLPPTYIDAAECEVFRDPAVTYATNMWRGGSTCELHIWPGAFHLFDGMDNPGVPLIHNAILAKRAWLRRVIGKVSSP